MSSRTWSALRAAINAVIGQAAPAQGSIRFIAGGNFTGPFLDFIDSASARSTSITPLDFGCVGDGVTDDTVNLQSCLAAGRNGGPAIIFPTNFNFAISNQITLGKQIVLRGGVGGFGTITALAGFPANTPMLRLDDPSDASLADSIQIFDMFINANNHADICMLAQDFQEISTIQRALCYQWNKTGIKFTTGRGGGHVPQNWSMWDIQCIGNLSGTSGGVGIELNGTTGSNKIIRATCIPFDLSGGSGLWVHNGGFCSLSAVHIEQCHQGALLQSGVIDWDGGDGNSGVTYMINYDSGSYASWRNLHLNGTTQVIPGSLATLTDSSVDGQTRTFFADGVITTQYTQASQFAPNTYPGFRGVMGFVTDVAGGVPTWTDTTNNVNRLADGNPIAPYFTGSITANAGGGQGSATALPSLVNRVTVCASNGDSLKLPAGLVGMKRKLIVAGGIGNPQVFGTGSDKVNDAASGTGSSQAAGTTKTYEFVGSDGWYG